MTSEDSGPDLFEVAREVILQQSKRIDPLAIEAALTERAPYADDETHDALSERVEWLISRADVDVTWNAAYLRQYEAPEPPSAA